MKPQEMSRTASVHGSQVVAIYAVTVILTSCNLLKRTDFDAQIPPRPLDAGEDNGDDSVSHGNIMVSIGSK